MQAYIKLATMSVLIAVKTHQQKDGSLPVAIHVRLVGQTITHSVDMGTVGAGLLRGLGALAFGPTQHAIVCRPRGVDVVSAHLQLTSDHLYCCSSPAGMHRQC